MRMRATGVISGGRSTVNPCQNVEIEFITHAATMLHTNHYIADYSFTSARVHAGRQLYTSQIDRDIYMS